MRVDLQRLVIVLQRSRIVFQHAHDFPVGILRIGLIGQGRDVLVHQRRSEARLTAVCVAIRQIVHRREISRIAFQQAHQNRFAMFIGCLIGAEPFRGHVGQALVVRIFREQVVHCGNGGHQIAVLGAVHPPDQQLLIGSRVGDKFHGQRTFPLFLFRIGREVTQRGVAQGKLRIGLHGFAKEFKAFVHEEPVLALHHAHFVGASRGERVRRHRHGFRRRGNVVARLFRRLCSRAGGRRSILRLRQGAACQNGDNHPGESVSYFHGSSHRVWL